MDYSKDAVAWVNLLVPGSFEQAEALVAPECRFKSRGKLYEGRAVVDAFRESHAQACRELDDIHYLPATFGGEDPRGVIVGVADELVVKGRRHTYRDRLIIKMRDGLVFEIIHFPIPEEREALTKFLSS